ncbi:MAG: O-antigen ligase family protein [Ruminococcaceae bacterium]|nr:O-antigen ligase family protein [Oscillospiraceae bacterium]
MPSLTKKNRIISFVYIILCMGFLLKIKNTSNTPNVTSAGGIWNVVTVALYVIWFFIVIVFNKKIALRTHGMFGVLFSIMAMISSIMHTGGYTVSFLYNLAIIPYFMFILSLFTELGRRYGEESLQLGIYSITFFLISLYVGYFMIGYQSTGDSMYVITDVYYSLNMLPLLLLVKNKIVKYASVGLTAFILILSGKRTGFIALLIGMLIYYIVTAYCNKNLKEKTKTIFGMIAAMVVIGFLFTYLTKFYELDLLERLETAFNEGEGGREKIWGKIIEDLRESSLFEILFGHGLKSVPALIGSKNALAHCDYLEIIYDYGIIAFIFYIGFWLAIIGKVISSIINKSQYAGILAFAVVIAMFLSMFSNYVIDATYITYSMIIFGIIFGIMEREEKNYEQAHSA